MLKDKHGNVIDGFHRLDEDKNKKRLKLEHIDSKEKLLVARAVNNWHRRKISRKEKVEWINGLAKIYSEQGYKISGEWVGSAGAAPNEIRDKIVEVTGLNKNTVNIYLSDEFKQVVRTISDKPLIPASERIKYELGEEYVERVRKEIQEEGG